MPSGATSFNSRLPQAPGGAGAGTRPPLPESRPTGVQRTPRVHDPARLSRRAEGELKDARSRVKRPARSMLVFRRQIEMLFDTPEAILVLLLRDAHPLFSVKSTPWQMAEE
jgi:hypothetical protein